MKRIFWMPATSFAATLVAVWTAFGIERHPNHFLYVWPVTAVQLGLALVVWNEVRLRWTLIAAGCAGVAVGTWLLGVSGPIAGLMTVLNPLEVWLAGMMLSGRIKSFDDLKKQLSVQRLGTTALVAPLAAGVIIGWPLAEQTHKAVWRAIASAAMADSLGIMVVMPCVLFWCSGEFRSWRKLKPHMPAAIPAAILFLGVTALIFFQNKVPLLFLVYPPMVVILLLLGLEGASFASVMLTMIGCVATAHRLGPIWMFQVVDQDRRILTLQIFLWTTVATAFPIGALLDEKRRSERGALENAAIYRMLLQNAADMIIQSSLDGVERFVSPAVEKVTGWTQAEFLTRGQMGNFHPDDVDLAQKVVESLKRGKREHHFRYRTLRKDGSYCWVDANVQGYSRAESSEIVGYVATVRDITDLKETEEMWMEERAALTDENRRLAVLASRDDLTTLANRRTFNRVLDHEAARHKRSGKAFCMMLLDVDNFKLYNDLYGHQAGDECLMKLARTMRECAERSSDLVARLGGEEFAILLPATDEMGARQVAGEILQAVVALQIPHAGSVYGMVTVSIGLAIWPPSIAMETTELIQAADRVLYEAKADGRNCMVSAMAYTASKT